MNATIYHNPRCSSSRHALEILRAAGIEPVVIDYQKRPPSKRRLQQLLRDARVSVRDAIRTKESVYGELGLDDPSLDDEALLEAMVSHPILIQRPLVETTKGVRLCRPAERVRELI